MSPTQQDSDSQASPIYNWLILILLSVVAYFAFFYRLTDWPLQLWDESRNANNSLEMYYRGWSIVTYFDGEPELWNTKPPLLNWVHNLFFKIFGPSLLSLRLPSALAGLGTTLLVYLFSYQILQNRLIAIYACLILMSTWGFTGYHAARTGDYDALLTLFTTIYLLAFYCYLVEKNFQLYLAICSCFIVLAFLTKTVQALIFLPSLVICLLWKRHFLTFIGSRLSWLWISFIGLSLLSFYNFREIALPGYIDATLINDYFGRFNSSVPNIDAQRTGAFYYLRWIIMAAPWVYILPAAIIFIFREDSRPAYRKLCSYLLCCSAFYFIVINLSNTKILWYLAPMYPLLAIVMAIGIYELQQRLAGTYHFSRHVITTLFCLLLATYAVATNLTQINAEKLRYQNKYRDHIPVGPFIVELATVHPEINQYVLIEQGYPETESLAPAYIAPTLFYMLQLREKGMKIKHLAPNTLGDLSDQIAVYCGDTLKRNLRKRYIVSPLYESGPCEASYLDRD